MNCSELTVRVVAALGEIGVTKLHSAKYHRFCPFNALDSALNLRFCHRLLSTKVQWARIAHSDLHMRLRPLTPHAGDCANAFESLSKLIVEMTWKYADLMCDGIRIQMCGLQEIESSAMTPHV